MIDITDEGIVSASGARHFAASGGKGSARAASQDCALARFDARFWALL